MKFPLLTFCLLFAASQVLADVAFVAPSTGVSDETLLSAIAEVETGNNPAKRGRFGERSQLQIRPETWREFSRLPHAASVTNPMETDRVARAYLDVIRKRLRARGLPETPFFIAASWNAGPGWRRLGRGTVAYAEHVANLVDEELAATKLPEPVQPTPLLPIQLPPNLLGQHAALTAVQTIPVIGEEAVR
jgi:hypothetical protein